MLKIECGLNVHSKKTDYHSAAIDRMGKPKSGFGFPQYVIFAACPHPDADIVNTDLSHINLIVPETVDLERIKSPKEAEKLVLSGNVYTCNRRGTPLCPFSSKKS